MRVFPSCDSFRILALEQHDLRMLPVLLLFSFRKLGDEWFVDQEVTDELEAFTCTQHHAKEDGRGERGTYNQI